MDGITNTMDLSLSRETSALCLPVSEAGGTHTRTSGGSKGRPSSQAFPPCPGAGTPGQPAGPAAHDTPSLPPQHPCAADPSEPGTEQAC